MIRSSHQRLIGSSKTKKRTGVRLEFEPLESRDTPSLVAAYAFGEGTGLSTADATGNGQAGTLTNAAWTAGKFGNGLSFNGTSALVSVNSSPLLQLTTAMTLEAWVNPDQVTSAWRTVLKKGSGDYFLFGTSDSNGELVGGSRVAGSILQAFGTLPLPANVWTHLALTFDGAAMRLYVNGQLVSMAYGEGTLQTSSNALQIGGDNVSGAYFQGKIDEVRVYNNALSGDQIRIDMNTPIIAGGDTQAPTSPTNLTAAGVSGGQIDLSWAASSDNVGVPLYRVERFDPRTASRNGTKVFSLVGTSTQTSFSDIQLPANTLFYYRVRAVDAAGNVSGTSNTIGASTRSTPVSFESGSGIAALFGTYEITLTGNGNVANPFDTPATATFTAPNNQQVTVNAFYDGGNIWRARAYVVQAGLWHWSTSSTDSSLNGRTGSFTASDTGLPGLLKLNPTNPKAWVNERNDSFVYRGEDGWVLLNENPAIAGLYQGFVNDAATQGINTIGPVSLTGSWGNAPYFPEAGVGDPWAPSDTSRFDLNKFQTTDTRLEWILGAHSEMYIQGHFLGRQWSIGNDWSTLPQALRNKTLDYMLARWSAFPNLIWLISWDQDTTNPAMQAFNRDVGNYIKAHSPWNHLLSTHSSTNTFALTTPSDLNWVDYIALQAGDDGPALGGDAVQNFSSVPRHVQLTEDWYEQDDAWHVELSDSSDVSFYVRWEFWSWMLAGGSANYGARWDVVQPYSQTGTLPYIQPVSGTDFTGRALEGLDSMPFIGSYFENRGIDLSQFQQSNSLLVSWSRGSGLSWHPNLARRGNVEYLVYSPNAGQEGSSAHLDTARTASFTINLSAAAGTFGVEWYRPKDGVVQSGGTVSGGGNRTFTAPWQGVDVVMRLVLQAGGSMGLSQPQVDEVVTDSRRVFAQAARQLYSQQVADRFWAYSAGQLSLALPNGNAVMTSENMAVTDTERNSLALQGRDVRGAIDWRDNGAKPAAQLDPIVATAPWLLTDFWQQGAWANRV